jgi:hypothetical protein
VLFFFGDKMILPSPFGVIMNVTSDIECIGIAYREYDTREISEAEELGNELIRLCKWAKRNEGRK